jgi:hypothetical protein
MASIYIVNVSVGGYYVEQHSYYHRTESEAQESYDECLESAGDDPTTLELVRLDTESLDVTTIHHWEGTIDDLEEDPEDGEEGFDDEDDGIVEGSP